MKLRDKSGFATIYLVIIFSSLIFLLLAFIEISSGYAARLMCDDMTKVSGRSVLGGYSQALYNRYGLFAFKADEESLKKELYSILRTDCRVNKALIRLDVEDIYLDTSPYPALSPDIIGKQISKLSVSGIISDILSKDRNMTNEAKNINSNPTIPKEILPSQLMGYSSRETLLFSGGLNDLSVQSSMEDEYILAFCSHHNNQKENTYLINEIEYILFGYKTDKENLNSLKRSLIALRLAVDTAQEPVMPSDPAQLAIKIAELTIKATKEAEEIIDNKLNNNDYEHYLRIFLKLLDREEKFARLMDIMQINLQYIDGSGFAFSDYSCGLDLSVSFSKDVVAPNTFGISRKLRTVDMNFEYN